jgi:hypothetical protein
MQLIASPIHVEMCICSFFGLATGRWRWIDSAAKQQKWAGMRAEHVSDVTWRNRTRYCTLVTGCSIGQSEIREILAYDKCQMWLSKIRVAYWRPSRFWLSVLSP